jgi:hypothetical protein
MRIRQSEKGMQTIMLHVSDQVHDIAMMFSQLTHGQIFLLFGFTLLVLFFSAEAIL